MQQPRRKDMSIDVSLRDNSVSWKSFLQSVMSNISKSIERMVGPKTIDFEKEKHDFQKFLATTLIPKIKEDKESKVELFSMYEKDKISKSLQEQ